MDTGSKGYRKLVWIPSSAPDHCERRLFDRLSKFAPAICRTQQQVVDCIRETGASAALVNCPSDTCGAADILEAVHNGRPDLSIYVRGTTLTTGEVMQLTRRGAAGIFGREADESTIAREIESALFRDVCEREHWRRGLIGSSVAIQRICSTVELVSQRRGTVLLTGETGTGKEVVARAIHMAGKRADRPFVGVNCGAIPGPLLESELFGHVRGAFTGASMQRIGRFEQAQGGTIFLDEIGDLDLELQTKLLRVLQEREMQRLGGSETIRLDVRVIAATHADLTARVRERAFREDLYYRLNVLPIQLPPLRARKSDIPDLANHILRKICAVEQISLRTLSDGALMALMEYSWPGNVRELENTLERAVTLCGDRLLLTDNDFDLVQSSEVDEDCSILDDVPGFGFDYEKAVSRFEWNLLSKALRKAGGNKQAAADLLGLKRTTLAAKVKVLSTTAGALVM